MTIRIRFPGELGAWRLGAGGTSAGLPAIMQRVAGRAASLVVPRRGRRSGDSRATEPFDMRLWRGVFGSVAISEVVFRHVRAESLTSCAALVRELARIHCDRPAEFKAVLAHRVREDRIRQLGAHVGGLDDALAMAVLDVFQQVGLDDCDCVVIRGLKWEECQDDASSAAFLNDRVFQFLRSDIAGARLTGLGMAFHLRFDHPASVPVDLLTPLAALKTLELTCSASGTRCLKLDGTPHRLEEVKLEFGEPGMSLRHLVTLSGLYMGARTLALGRCLSQDIKGIHIKAIAEAAPGSVVVASRAKRDVRAAARKIGLSIRFDELS